MRLAMARISSTPSESTTCRSCAPRYRGLRPARPVPYDPPLIVGIGRQGLHVNTFARVPLQDAVRFELADCAP